MAAGRPFFDPVFGPLILLGSGGVWVEILRDVKIYLTPMDRAMARAAEDARAVVVEALPGLRPVSYVHGRRVARRSDPPGRSL